MVCCAVRKPCENVTPRLRRSNALSRVYANLFKNKQDKLCRSMTQTTPPDFEGQLLQAIWLEAAVVGLDPGHPALGRLAPADLVAVRGWSAPALRNWLSERLSGERVTDDELDRIAHNLGVLWRR